MSLLGRAPELMRYFTARHPDVEPHRILLLVLFCWVAALVALASSAADPSHGLAFAVYGAGIVFVPLLLRARLPFVVVCVVSAIATASLFLLINNAGPAPVHRNLYWFAVLPLTHALLMGRIGLLYGASLAYAGASVTLLRYHDWDPLEAAAHEASIDAVVFITAMLAITAIYHRLESRARASLEATVRARSAFLAQMSHELRTPMNGVLGMVEVMRRDPDVDRDAGLDVIARSGRDMVELIDELLDHAKLDAGRVEVVASPCRPHTIVRDIAELARPALEDGVTLRVDIEESVPDGVLLDGSRLRQVLRNLVSNASKFTAEGEIHVRLGWGEDILHGEVRDTGIGIAEAHRERLFKPFEQARAETAERYGGTGLGLAISRSLCRLMGGDLVLAPGHGPGSTFRFHVKAPACAPPAPQAQHRTRRVVADARILLVEDNPVNQLVGRKLCARMGLEVDVVGHGREAIDALAHRDYALVLMDCRMPEMDGWEATRRIRASQASYAELPIIALTASLVQEDLERCADAGMNEVLAKPIDVAELRRVVQTYLEAGEGSRPIAS